jgi:hypothetical protein
MPIAVATATTAAVIQPMLIDLPMQNSHTGKLPEHHDAQLPVTNMRRLVEALG